MLTGLCSLVTRLWGLLFHRQGQSLHHSGGLLPSAHRLWACTPAKAMGPLDVTSQLPMSAASKTVNNSSSSAIGQFEHHAQTW